MRLLIFLISSASIFAVNTLDNIEITEEILLGDDNCATFWNTDDFPKVSVSIDTYATDKQRSEVEMAINELNNLNLSLQYELVDSSGLIGFEFIENRASFFDGDRNTSLLELQAFGYTMKEGFLQNQKDNCFYIDQARIVVDKDLNDIHTNQTIFHELMHSAGLGHSSCSSSIMYDGEENTFNIAQLNQLPLETIALNILYSSNPSFVDREFISSTLNSSNLNNLTLCQNQTFEIVSFENNIYVCKISELLSSCFVNTSFIENSTSSDIDLWCDIASSQCDYYPFLEWNYISFDNNNYYCDTNNLCVLESLFNPNMTSQELFSVKCGEEFCEYLESVNESSSTSTENSNELNIPSTTENSNEPKTPSTYLANSSFSQILFFLILLSYIIFKRLKREKVINNNDIIFDDFVLEDEKNEYFTESDFN